MDRTIFIRKLTGLKNIRTVVYDGTVDGTNYYFIVYRDGRTGRIAAYTGASGRIEWHIA